MPLTVLSVAFPLTAVGPDATGGSEQILSTMDEAIHTSGHRSLVIACEGSQVAGELIATIRWDGDLNNDVRAWGQQEHLRAIERALVKYDIDLIHMHGLDWHRYLPAAGVPLLATLHLPPAWYPEQALSLARGRTFLNCVSRSQFRSAVPLIRLPLSLVENGVPIDRFSLSSARRDFVFALGRICPEKGLHLALDAARRAGVRVLLAGEVYRYETHLAYFANEIVPRLDADRTYCGPVGRARKCALMSEARCVLIPSLVPETSSLVAMESLACGTPVIAYRSGALPEIIEHGRTGFLVNDEREMAEAISLASSINPEDCREAARTRFSAARMARDYLSLYDLILRAETSLEATQSHDAIH